MLRAIGNKSSAVEIRGFNRFYSPTYDDPPNNVSSNRLNSGAIYQPTPSSNSLLSSLASGKIFGNGDSRQPISFQARSCFPLFASNPINSTFSGTPIQISTSTPSDYSRGERYQQPVSILDRVSSGAIFRGNHNSNSMFNGSPNYTNSQNNNFSSREMRMPEPQIVNPNKQVPENSFFPLFTATNTRVQTPKDLYFSRPSSTYHPPKREPRMPQSLLDQMSSGAIFVVNSNRNQTVTQYNRLYTEMPMFQPYPQNHCQPRVVIASMPVHRPGPQPKPVPTEYKLSNTIFESKYLRRIICPNCSEVGMG